MRPAVALALLLAIGCAAPGGAEGPASSADTDRALALYAEAKFEEAQSKLESILRRSPSDALARRLLGRIHLLHNRLPAAVEHLGEAVRLSKDRRGHVDVLAVQDLTWAYYRMDDYARAAGGFRVLNETILESKYRTMAGRRPPYTTTWRGDRAVVPFFERTPLPVLQIRVNGVGGLFIVDTGVGEIVLDRGFAAAARVEAPGGGAAEEGYIDTLELPGLQVRNVPVGVRELQPLGTRKIDGVVGSAFLAHFVATLDQKRERLILGRPGSELPSSGPGLLLYLWADRYFLTPGEVEGRATLLLLRTGLQGRGFVPSPTLQLQVPQIRRVACGPLRPRIEADTAGFPAGLDYAFGFPVGGLLGAEAFRGRSITLDMDRMRLLVE